LGAGMASYVFNRASRIFLVTGPVTTIPSAWRGDAVNCIPNLASAKTGVFNTLRSSSQALHPPAEPGGAQRPRKPASSRHRTHEKLDRLPPTARSPRLDTPSWKCWNTRYRIRGKCRISQSTRREHWKPHIYYRRTPIPGTSPERCLGISKSPALLIR
jgi:hypothetical protein